MVLRKVDLNAVAAQLDRPFLLEQIAHVDHFGVYLYHCEGVVARHSHITQDELFYVFGGMLSLDTDWGRVTLSEKEFALMPRGLAHVSGALTRTIVMLFQARGDVERKNGHGRQIIEHRDGSLPRGSVAESASHLHQPYSPMPLAQVDEMSFRIILCEGQSSWHIHPDHDEMLFVTEGTLDIGSESGPMTIIRDELVVIPRNSIHRLTSPERTVVLSLIHSHVEPQKQMGE